MYSKKSGNWYAVSVKKAKTYSYTIDIQTVHPSGTGEPITDTVDHTAGDETPYIHP